ncbi:MAG: hypothetical protein FJZ10_01910 [Candidatus Omnitrophica bacterium]|nr:hypothetical protein [Candidatus Omnitrophota bacterium]
MRKVNLLFIVLLVFLAIYFSFFKNISAQDTASGSILGSQITEKLDKILIQQTEILKQIEAMSKEIKARCTR